VPLRCPGRQCDQRDGIVRVCCVPLAHRIRTTRPAPAGRSSQPIAFVNPCSASPRERRPVPYFSIKSRSGANRVSPNSRLPCVASPRPRHGLGREADEGVALYSNWRSAATLRCRSRKAARVTQERSRFGSVAQCGDFDRVVPTSSDRRASTRNRYLPVSSGKSSRVHRPCVRSDRPLRPVAFRRDYEPHHDVHAGWCTTTLADSPRRSAIGVVVTLAAIRCLMGNAAAAAWHRRARENEQREHAPLYEPLS